MPAQVLDSREIEEFFSAPEASRFSPCTIAASPSNLIALPLKIAASQDPDTRDGNCLTGLAFALGLQAAAGMIAYGVWQLL